MKRRAAGRERGAALIAFVAAIVLGTSWMLVSRLNEASANRIAEREHNARVLAEAKAALIGWMAQKAVDSDEKNPGRLPCPEHEWYIGNADKEGIMGPAVGVPNPGWGTANCSTIGRLPWRSLGLPKLSDASGEPLWYIVSPGWALQSSSSSLSINSDTPGQLSVDGQNNAAVALIIAPGRPLNTAPNASQQAAGCTARVQRRGRTPPNHLDYLECQNVAGRSFRTAVPGNAVNDNPVFNDQVLVITTADLLPALEAAIAHRIEREIVPALRDVYVAPNWGLAGSDRVYPYAAPFANPSTSSFTGAAGTTQGLLPLSFMESYPGSGVACNPATDGPRCNPTLVRWTDPAPSISRTGGGSLVSLACGYIGPTSPGWCWGTYTGHPATIRLSGRQSGGAMSLRQLNSAATGSALFIDLTTFQSSSSTPTPSVGLEADGTFTVSVTVTPPAPAGTAGVFYILHVPGNATSDHSLLDSRIAGAATSWFIRNRWHELVYYAVAPGYTAAAPAPRGCTGETCLTVANLLGEQRAILILAGRSINGRPRPSAQLADYLEFGNATGPLERLTISAWNGAMYADTGTENAYVVPAPSVGTGTVFVFRAANANTGPSTLWTPTTGFKNLVNADGTELAADTIPRNGAVQVFYDGSRFILAKRPSNDRIVVIAQNPPN